MHDMGGFLCGTEVSVSRGKDTASYVSYLRMLETRPTLVLRECCWNFACGLGLGNGILDHTSVDGTPGRSRLLRLQFRVSWTPGHRNRDSNSYIWGINSFQESTPPKESDDLPCNKIIIWQIFHCSANILVLSCISIAISTPERSQLFKGVDSFKGVNSWDSNSWLGPRKESRLRLLKIQESRHH